MPAARRCQTPVPAGRVPAALARSTDTIEQSPVNSWPRSSIRPSTETRRIDPHRGCMNVERKPRHARRLGIAALALAGAATTAAAWAAVPAAAPTQAPAAAPSQAPAAALSPAAPAGVLAGRITEARRKVYPALVNISAVKRFFEQGHTRRSSAGGSGVVVSPDGYVLTNYHVASDATHILCRLPDGEEFEANVVTDDPLTDLSVLKLRLDRHGTARP